MYASRPLQDQKTETALPTATTTLAHAHRPSVNANLTIENADELQMARPAAIRFDTVRCDF